MPRASILRVLAFDKLMMSSLEPTASSRLPRIAMASAFGLLEDIV
jgi:hypothetical protein